MHNKFEQDKLTTFNVIAHTSSNYRRKMQKSRNKSAISIFFQPLLSLSANWSLVTCITNLKRIHEKLFKVFRPQVNVNADANADDAEIQLQ